jgi:hypothetical protein
MDEYYEIALSRSEGFFRRGELFFEVFNYLRLAQNSMIEYWGRKEIEGIGHGLIEVLFRHLPAGTAQDHSHPQDNLMPWQIFEASIFWTQFYSITATLPCLVEKYCRPK